MEDYQWPLAGFEQGFTTDAACRAYLAKLRWPSGPPQGGISREQLDYSLDEFTFRFNRRTFRHRGKLFYRLVHNKRARSSPRLSRSWSLGRTTRPRSLRKNYCGTVEIR